MAKQRHAAAKAVHGGAQLADAQLQIAREHGFSSWRAMKMQIDRSPLLLAAENVPSAWKSLRRDTIADLRTIRNPMKLEQSFFLTAAVAMGFLQLGGVVIFGLLSLGA